MKDFIALQKHARELEHRLTKMPPTKETRVIRVRIVKEWEAVKEQLAKLILEKEQQ